jgi:membrane-associated HD superfamily phosphohydrolase
MNELENPNPPPPDKEDQAFRKLVNVVVALLPSAIGILCFQFKFASPNVLPVMVIVNAVLSAVGSAGLVRGMKNATSAVITGILLTGFFFGLNAIIVVFVGCSGMGRIAP